MVKLQSYKYTEPRRIFVFASLCQTLSKQLFAHKRFVVVREDVRLLWGSGEVCASLHTHARPKGGAQPETLPAVTAL